MVGEEKRRAWGDGEIKYMWSDRGRGRAFMNSMLSEKNVVRTRSEPGREVGTESSFFFFVSPW